tara:strand:- start:368 stop:1153 length:786 start_codon:yes stop_codon:yes gene_type:complete
MLKKIILSFSILIFSATPVGASADAPSGDAPKANSASANTPKNGVVQLRENLGNFGNQTGLGAKDDDDLKGKIASIINIVLGFLGIVALVMIIFAGFKWMTAGGNEETVKEARGNIKNAVIGVAVVFMSFIVVNFVVLQLSDATGSGGGGGDGDVIVSPTRFFEAQPDKFLQSSFGTLGVYRFCAVGDVTRSVTRLYDTCDTVFNICARHSSICTQGIDVNLRASRGICIDDIDPVQDTASKRDRCKESFVTNVSQINYRK